MQFVLIIHRIKHIISDLAKHEKMSSIDLQKEGTIPDGKYTFIGLDIDATGKRILDEVCYF